MLLVLSLFLFLSASLINASTLQFYIEPTQKIIPTYVQQLVEGSIQRIQQGSRMRASVSLIFDGGYYILVDTPSATDLRGKEAMLKGISTTGIVPGEIQFSITTNSDPDHRGQDNFFPNARHFFGSYEYSDDTYISTELKISPKMQLTKNVELWSTPGHTSHDISVIVRNVPCCDTVAVVGDLFYNEDDALNGTEWFAEAWNPLIGKLNRDKVICGADYIIPGHGKLFKITDEMKMNAACGAISLEDLDELTSDYNKKRDTPRAATVSFTYSYPTTTSPVTTTIVPPSKLPTTTPFFVTVDQLPEASPEIRNLVNSVNEAIPYVMTNVIPKAANQFESHVKRAQQNPENILAPIVESASRQLSNLLKVESPEAVNSSYPYTTYWQKTFNKLVSDIPNLKNALSSENVANLKERVRTYRHPAVDGVFQLFNSMYLSPPNVKRTNP